MKNDVIKAHFDNWSAVCPGSDKEQAIQYPAFVGGWNARRHTIEAMLRELIAINPKAADSYRQLWDTK